MLAILFQPKTLQTTSTDKPSAQNIMGNNRVLTILWLDCFRQPSNNVMEIINECVLQTVNLKYLVVSIYINISWILNTFFCFQHIKGKSGLAVLLAFMVATMTFAKTVLYFLISTPLCGGQDFVNHSNLKKLIILYIIPNGIWIVVPFFCMIATGKIMLDCMEYGKTTTKRKSH